MHRMSVASYFRRPESTQPMELSYGLVREAPAAPSYSHQRIVTRLSSRLDQHTRELALGTVCVSPIDVVLDRERALVLQPDLVFVSNERANIIVHDRIWGAPDLVVEVLSLGTARRDRTVKLSQYRRYGVRECWLIDPVGREVQVVVFASGRTRRRKYAEYTRMKSDVFPGLRLRAGDALNV